jgi:pyruvate,water dikinase
MSAVELTDPLHIAPAHSDVAWTTVNISEAIPGIPTPLTWSWYQDAFEFAFTGAFVDLGVLPRTALGAAPRFDERCAAIFHGRPALNVDMFRRMADASPGSSGDSMEEQMFGRVRTAARRSHPHRGRYPVILTRTPLVMATLPRRCHRTHYELDAWWTRQHQLLNATGPTDPELARTVLADAVARFALTFRLHLVASMVAQAQFDQLRGLTEAVGRPELLDELVSGYASIAETATVTDLWDLSRDRITEAEFLRRHGYHGPNEGELASRSWREDPTPLESLLRAFADRPDSEDPRQRMHRQAAARQRAERDLITCARGARRPAARILPGLTRRYVPLRELGKAAFLRTLDVARAATRALGHHHADTGRLADPDDVCYLTVPELLTGLPGHSRELVAHRRDRREHYLSLRLPDFWQGVPDPSTRPASSDSPTGTETALSGLAVSPGTVTAPARVVLDPSRDDDFDAGDVLVCRTTDPSWASLFFLASAVVIDIGGPMSHGAIVARELGIPCVINVGTATTTIRTGDTVTVDGRAGTIIRQPQGGNP